MVRHREEAHVDLSLLPATDAVDRGAHIVVDPALRDAAKDTEPVPIGAEQDSWVCSGYLSAPVEGEPVAAYENRKMLNVTTVYNDEEIAKNATGAARSGGIAGALIAGPVGAAVGVAEGGATVALAKPPEGVTTYVITNEVEPVYLDGEVIVSSSRAMLEYG
jgi:hypothetical protein